MKKNFLALVFVLVCVFTLTACFESGSEVNDKPEGQQPFTVTFETNGGSAIDPINCTARATLKNILDGKTTSKQGKVFTGWYGNEELTEEVGLNSFIFGDCTLYAGWRDRTDDEILEDAITYAYENAVAVTDSGYVRTGISTSAASTVDAIFTLNKGEVTACSNGTRFYDGEFVYQEYDKDKIKMTLAEASEAYAFIYHGDKFKSLTFFQAFSPLCMGLLAGTGSTYPVTKSDNVTTVEYKGSYSSIGLNWNKFNDPNIYFDAGKKFEFTFSGDRLSSVKQSGIKPRTVTFYYEGDELPAVAEPQDKDAYEQRWQLNVAVAGGGTRPLYKANMNKEELDKEIFGADYKPQTSKLTYYENEGMTKPVKFIGGVAELNSHVTIYHPGIDYDNTTVAYYEYTFAKTAFVKVSETEKDGIKTTALRALQPMYGSSFYISVNQRPTNAKNKSVKVSFVETPTDDEELYADAISLTENDYGTQMNIAFPVSGEYLLKIESTDGTVLQYLKILPKL